MCKGYNSKHPTFDVIKLFCTVDLMSLQFLFNLLLV